MILNKETTFRWLCFLVMASALAFVFSLQAQALDSRILERLPMGYTENPDNQVIQGAFDKDAYGGGVIRDEPPPEEEPPLEGEAEEDTDKYAPHVLDSGQVLDSGVDPQTQMYDDISSIRRGVEIIVYFVIPMIIGAFLIFKFCSWFYSTFIETAWNK